ncbi:carbohydrate sulfotransferase 11-like [Mizuhopecten yessoensis]|uniref:Carbohydrate sulfotransferase n=1 Tax=Mizuhopecten yessoensis TaxID=6573 RepID=A0A210QJ08_MIZYE|nr:carbohydrate sulfotransferase 11-like [Mizuhopecten yessoensis]OWF48744.1 Carbohydrate sulfotransferase 11 [Mizuhopecten yessoensis]
MKCRRVNKMLKSRKIFICIAVVGIVVPLVFLSQTARHSSSHRQGPKTKVVARFRDNVLGSKSSVVTSQNTNIPANVIQKERLATLQQGCHQLESEGVVPNSVIASQLGHILVDDTYQVMFCYIPKVACTNMKRVFLLLTGTMNTTNPLDIKSNDVHFTYDKHLKYLSDYSSEVEINYRIKSYKKIIFVREPLERLLSAYRNKFMEKSEYFHRRFGRRIIKRYRENPSVSSVELGNDVQFIEFIRYITDSSTLRREGYNEHWAHYSGLCHPCLIRYDYIGKYETIDQDIDQILRDLHIDQIIKFPARGATYKRKKTKDTMADFYGKIPPPHLRLLWKIYVNDYKLFGYPYPEVLQQFLSDPGQT